MPQNGLAEVCRGSKTSVEPPRASVRTPDEPGSQGRRTLAGPGAEESPARFPLRAAPESGEIPWGWRGSPPWGGRGAAPRSAGGSTGGRPPSAPWGEYGGSPPVRFLVGGRWVAPRYISLWIVLPLPGWFYRGACWRGCVGLTGSYQACLIPCGNVLTRTCSGAVPRAHRSTAGERFIGLRSTVSSLNDFATVFFPKKERFESGPIKPRPVDR